MVAGNGEQTTDGLIQAIERYAPGSCAPHVVALIYSMTDLTIQSKRAMAAMFLGAYREMSK